MSKKVNEQLLKAAYDGDLDGVNDALQQGASIEAKEQFGDTALNQAAENGHLEVVKRLIEAGADINNKGGADKTPIKNAAFAGHVDIVRLLLEKGATVDNDLLSSVQMKVNILEENAENGMVRPEAVKAWKGFLSMLVGASLKQDLPEIIKALDSQDAGDRKSALEALESAVNRSVDVSAAVPRLREFLADRDADARNIASAVLANHYVRRKDWDPVRELLGSPDHDVKTGAIPVLVSAAQGEFDLSPLLPTLTDLLGDRAPNLRHDAAITLGYLATNGIDVSSAVPGLVKLLADPEAPARKMAAWAFCRIGKYGGDISAALPALRNLKEDEDEDVRSLAEEALDLGAARQA